MENNEIKKVSFNEYSEARKEMQNELDSFAVQLGFPKGCRYVEVYSDFGLGKPVNSEVNWSAVGSRPAGVAVKFAQLLIFASELARNFKYNGYKVFYAED